jgi:tetratricopeptide (TPR) repeat protein
MTLNPWKSFGWWKGARYAVALALTLGAAACFQSPEQRSARWKESAKTHLAAKEYGRAIIDLRNAAQTTPKDAEAHYLLGEALMKSGHPAAATQSFRKAAELKPNHAGARLRLAELLADVEDPKLHAQAEEHALAALAQRPDDPEILHALAAAEWRQKKTRLAAGHLRRALELAPAQLKSSIGLSSIQLSEERDPVAAEQTLKAAAEHAANRAEALVALGRFYASTGKNEDAEAQFGEAVKAGPNFGEGWVELARLLEAAGKQSEAEQALRRLLSLTDKKYRPLHALFLFRHGRQDAALQELKSLWEKEPDNSAVRGSLVELSMATGRLEEAEKVLDASLKRDSRDAGALEAIARIRLRQRRFSGAEQAVQNLLRIRPSSDSGRYLLAQAYRGLGRTPEFRNELRRALELNPSLLAARVELAESLRTSKALSEAQGIIDAAPASQKEALPLMIERNWLRFAQRRYAEAKPDVDKALAASRQPATLLQAGLFALQEKQYVSARSLLEEVLKLEPAHIEAMEAIAVSYASEGRAAAAVERLRRQAATVPGAAPVQFVFGAWLERTGDSAGARQAYRAALAADASYARAAVAMARLQMIDGRWEEARTGVQAVLGREPRNVDALLARGMIEEGTGQHAAAVKTYRAILQLDPAHVVAKNNLVARLCEGPETAEEALLLAQERSRAAPDDPEIGDTVGWAYFKRGRYETAVKYLESAAARKKSARILYHLAMANFKAGNRSQGRKALADAQQIDPHLAEAAEARMLADSTR